MFADLLNRLMQPEPSTDPLADEDARLALAALLVRVARTDGAYTADEMGQIDRILAARYHLGPPEVDKLRIEAEALEAQAPDTVRFTRTIKDAVAYEDRLAVIEALWGVVLADGVRDNQENTLLRLVSKLLGINDRDSNLARLRIQNAE